MFTIKPLSQWATNHFTFKFISNLIKTVITIFTSSSSWQPLWSSAKTISNSSAERGGEQKKTETHLHSVKTDNVSVVSEGSCAASYPPAGITDSCSANAQPDEGSVEIAEPEKLQMTVDSNICLTKKLDEASKSYLYQNLSIQPLSSDFPTDTLVNYQGQNTDNFDSDMDVEA